MALELVYMVPQNGTWTNMGSTGSNMNGTPTGTYRYGTHGIGYPHWADFVGSEAVCIPAYQNALTQYTQYSYEFTVNYANPASSGMTMLLSVAEGVISVYIQNNAVYFAAATSASGASYYWCTPANTLAVNNDYTIQISADIGTTPATCGDIYMWVGKNGATPTFYSKAGGNLSEGSTGTPSGYWNTGTGVAWIGNYGGGATCPGSVPSGTSGTYNLNAWFYVLRIWSGIFSCGSPSYAHWYADKHHMYYWSEPSTSILYSSWPSSGLSVTDSSGNGHTGTAHYQDYAPLASYSEWMFSHSDDYVYAASASNIANLDQFTMALGFYLRGYSYSTNPVLFYKKAGGAGHQAFLDTGGGIWISRETEGVADVWTTSGTAANLSTGNWYEVAISWVCGTAVGVAPYSAPKLVVNGSDWSSYLQHVAVPSGSPFADDNGQSLVIGQQDGSYGLTEALDANISIFRFSTTAASVAAMQSYYNSDKVRFIISNPVTVTMGGSAVGGGAELDPLISHGATVATTSLIGEGVVPVVPFTLSVVMSSIGAPVGEGVVGVATVTKPVSVVTTSLIGEGIGNAAGSVSYAASPLTVSAVGEGVLQTNFRLLTGRTIVTALAVGEGVGFDPISNVIVVNASALVGEGGKVNETAVVAASAPSSLGEGVHLAPTFNYGNTQTGYTSSGEGVVNAPKIITPVNYREKAISVEANWGHQATLLATYGNSVSLQAQYIGDAELNTSIEQTEEGDEQEIQ